MESVPSNLWKGKWCNTKSFNFGTKNALFVLFWDESFKKFCAKIKTLKFETKIILLGIFRLRIGKNDCDIWIRHPKICRNAQNCAKQTNKKTPFGPKMPSLGILGYMFEKVLSYFQHPRICQNAKFRTKLKILHFRTKNVWFRCF